MLLLRYLCRSSTNVNDNDKPHKQSLQFKNAFDSPYNWQYNSISMFSIHPAGFASQVHAGARPIKGNRCCSHGHEFSILPRNKHSNDNTTRKWPKKEAYGNEGVICRPKESKKTIAKNYRSYIFFGANNLWDMLRRRLLICYINFSSMLIVDS